MQSSTWKAPGLFTHCAKHGPTPPPPPRQKKKHCRSCAQLGFVKQAMTSLQQLFATQLPHAVPSEGHTGPAPQKPPLHWLLQQSPGLEQA